MRQRPLSECGYEPDLFLFGVEIPIIRIAETHELVIESFLQDGMGPTDAVFVVLESGASVVLYRYRDGSRPDATVVAGDPGCGDLGALAEEVVLAFGFMEEDLIVWDP